ncbi:MAG: hypothetical protein ACRDZ8_20680 [Acidimicrobiales bacterium]
MQDIGIWVVFLTIPTDNNVGVGNTVTGSGLDGIQLSRFSTTNTVSANTVAGNGFGQVRHGPRDGNGIVVHGNNRVVRLNTVGNSAANGIASFGGSGNSSSGDTAVGSGTGINSSGTTFDLDDTTPGCGTDVWHSNVIVTSNQPCVTG